MDNKVQVFIGGLRNPKIDIYLELNPKDKVKLIVDGKEKELKFDYFLGREVSVIHEGEGEYVGSISQDDIKIQKELRKHTELYNQLIQDPKRTVSLINKKMQMIKNIPVSPIL